MSVVQTMSGYSGKMFVDGAFVDSDGARFDVIDPATEERIGEAASCTDADVDAAVEIANRAQKDWAAKNFLTRAEIMHEVAHDMRAMSSALSEMLTRETGKPYKESADEVDWSASAIDYYAEIARHENGKVLGSNIDDQFHFTVKQPLGVAVVILPFNFPYVLLCWEAAAALAAGNAVIVKPSDLTSLSTLHFMKAFEKLPKGLIQCLPGAGNVGQRLVASTGTHVVCFTGGIETGKAVSKACAETQKRCLIEASGNDPHLIMPSAPVDMAARGASFAAYLHCGQVCVSSERFYVHEKIHDEFVDKLVANAEALRIGNGLEKVDLGPMAASRERDRFEKVMARAREEGAKVATGGGRPAEFNTGWFVEPTVLTDVTPDMDILNNESFGPAAPICKVSSFDEAIELANRSRYGLGACIYTTDLDEAMRSVNELEVGMVWVNAPLLDNDAGPFGGRKLSGQGRQLGAEGLDTFRHTKLAMVDYGCKAQDFWWFPYQDGEAFPGNDA